MKLNIRRLSYIISFCILVSASITPSVFLSFQAIYIEESSESTTLTLEDNSFNSIKMSYVPYNNITILSDGYNGKWGWNWDDSKYPSIAVDGSGNIHAVWHDETNNPSKWGYDDEIMYAKWTAATGWFNASVISDGYDNIWGWNDAESMYPSIAVDGNDNIHVVWYDGTDGKWGTDFEIMYANYSVSSDHWSNATVISDGYNDVWGWNNDDSWYPSIAVDGNDNIHVVWQDETNNTAKWGIDDEIMYANYTVGVGWSNATVISDGYGGIWGWNNDPSLYPSITADNSGNVHIVWQDETNNPAKWGSDLEIMYANYSVSSGKWSNATVISDGYNNKWGWNLGSSWRPSIVVDDSDNAHIVWYDSTANMAKWGADYEIMYANYSISSGKWSNATVISDGYNNIWGWNNNQSRNPSIAADCFGNIHVAWYDYTDNLAKWGSDHEIMYAYKIAATGKWSNATVISDGYNNVWGWNDQASWDPSIAADSSGNVHIVWHDETNNPSKWDDDMEIMYVKIQFFSSQILLGGDNDDDNDDDNEKRNIVYGYDIVLLIAAILSVSVIFLKKNLKNIKNNFVND